MDESTEARSGGRVPSTYEYISFVEPPTGSTTGKVNLTILELIRLYSRLVSLVPFS